MDAYSLASEKISPFFDSIDGIALAIAEHIPGLGLPSPEFDVDRALVLHSSTQAFSYYQQHRVHSRRSFSNPEAVSELVRDTLKQHYLITHDIAVTKNLGRFRSANSTSNSQSLRRFPLHQLALCKPIGSERLDQRLTCTVAPLTEVLCIGDFDISNSTQVPQKDTQLPGSDQVQANHVSWDFERMEIRDPESRKASHFYHHSRDSGVCLDDEESDLRPEPSRPQLRRRDNFPADYVSAQGDRKNGDDDPINTSAGEQLQQSQQRDSTLSSQSAESGQSNVITKNSRTLSLASFEKSMMPNTLSGYPIPYNLSFHSQPTQRTHPFLDEPPNKKEYFPAINGPFRQRQDPLKEKRRKMYSFFHRYYQSGGSPIDQKEFPLIPEGLWHINREHASHLVQELDGIARHQAHGGDQICCVPILPRCVVRELPRAKDEPPESWFSTIDEAWANRPRKSVR